VHSGATTDGVSNVVQEKTHKRSVISPYQRIGQRACALLRYRIADGKETTGVQRFEAILPKWLKLDTLWPEWPGKEHQVSESNPIRVFVTHTFEESDDYFRIFEFLESVDQFYYLNVSKPENVPTQGGMEAIKDELIQQIKASECVIVLPAVFNGQTELVTYMMSVADANNINMIAVRPFGGLLETPEAVVDRVKEHINWNAREMVDAIKRQARGEDTARWEVIDFPGLDLG